MPNIVSYLIIIAILLVAGILLAGLLNMARKGGSLSLSQQLMRWRVGVQFVAVCLIMVSLYLSGA